MADDQDRLREQVREDLALIKRAERVLAEIDRGQGLSGEQADVLVALRLRIEGKPRAKLEDLLTAAGEVSSKKDLGEVLGGGETSSSSEWPEVKDDKKEWPGL